MCICWCSGTFGRPQVVVMPRIFWFLNSDAPRPRGQYPCASRRPALWVEKQQDTSWVPPLSSFFILFSHSPLDSVWALQAQSQEAQRDWATAPCSAIVTQGCWGREADESREWVVSFGECSGSTVVSVELKIMIRGFRGKIFCSKLLQRLAVRSSELVLLSPFHQQKGLKLDIPFCPILFSNIIIKWRNRPPFLRFWLAHFTGTT